VCDNYMQLRVHVCLSDDAQGKSKIFKHLKCYRVFCFLVRSFPLLSHKEHNFSHKKMKLKSLYESIKV
jgi:hypothetical protein